MRKVIYVPIIHSEADMGRSAPALRRAYAARFGAGRWRKHQQLIATFWKETERALRNLRTDFSHVKLYQDGLPVCGREREIVEALADRGSPNHRLLLKLMAKGAQLVGTEDPALLLTEYEQIRTELSTGHSTAEAKRASQSLLDRRDRFVGSRIDATLAAGEVGIVFMGALHRVFEMLPPDVKLEFLVARGPQMRPRSRHRRGDDKEKEGKVAAEDPTRTEGR